MFSKQMETPIPLLNWRHKERRENMHPSYVNMENRKRICFK